MGHATCYPGELSLPGLDEVVVEQPGAHGTGPGTCLPGRTRPTVAQLTGTSLFRCGRCLATIPRLYGGHTIRCDSCGERLAIPGHVRLRCDRCGRRHHIRPAELGTEHLCPVCSQPLTVREVVLSPAHRHRARKPHAGNAVHRNPHDRAVSLMLLIGLILVAALMLLNRL